MHQTLLCPSPAGQTVRGGYVASSPALLLRMHAKLNASALQVSLLQDCSDVSSHLRARERLRGRGCRSVRPRRWRLQLQGRLRGGRDADLGFRRPSPTQRQGKGCTTDACSRAGTVGAHQRLSTSVFNTTKLRVAAGRLSQARAHARANVMPDAHKLRMTTCSATCARGWQRFSF